MVRQDAVEQNHKKESQAVESANWNHAVKWLLFLGPFFFISYGFANWLASQQAEVAHIIFSWETSIPFVPWTIIPYWSIDFLYVISLFICATRHELNTLAKRLLTAQIIAVSCFILFPMGFNFERPETHGLFGYLFTSLNSFDQPYNQAPSLHITLLIILWNVFPQHLPKAMLWPFHLLCMLIGISVLTTYQHHFIDIPAGVLLGVFCIWLWPDDVPSMFSLFKHKFHTTKTGTKDWHRFKLAIYYLTASIAFFLLAMIYKGWALWLIWPSISLIFTALFYAFSAPEGFQKSSNGMMSFASQCLLLPYLLAARLNSYLWTRNPYHKQTSASEIVDGVWLGRFPTSNEINKANYQTIIDMTAEMIKPFNRQADKLQWHSLSNLDLLTPSDNNLVEAANIIEAHRSHYYSKSILITCALGYSRSVMAVIIWLVMSHHSKTLDDAVEIMKEKHPQFIIKKRDYHQLQSLLSKRLINS